MNLEVVTPKGSALAVDAEDVTAPGVRGEFGVLPGHTPFISALKPGVLKFRQKGGKLGVLAVGAGFAEVTGKDQVVVVAQAAALADQIDGAEAQKELDEADRALKEWRATEGGPTRESLEARRAWAQAKLDAKAASRS